MACETMISTQLFYCPYVGSLPVFGLKLLQIRLWLSFAKKTPNLRQVLLLGVAKLSVVRVISIVCLQTGTRVVSIIQSREVAAKQGFLMYYSEWRCSRDQGINVVSHRSIY